MGSNVGEIEGSPDGAILGSPLGLAVGVLVGLIEGLCVGLREGLFVVGDLVGLPGQKSEQVPVPESQFAYGLQHPPVPHVVPVPVRAQLFT